MNRTAEASDYAIQIAESAKDVEAARLLLRDRFDLAMRDGVTVWRLADGGFALQLDATACRLLVEKLEKTEPLNEHAHVRLASEDEE